MDWSARRILQEIRDSLVLLIVAALPIVLLSIDGLLPVYKKQFTYDLLYRSPYILIAVIALLGYKLNQTRILFSALALGLSYAFLTSETLPGIFRMKSVEMGILIGMTLPLSFALNLTFGEGPLFGLKSFFRFLIAVLPLIGLAYTCGQIPPVKDVVLSRWFAKPVFWHLSETGLILAATCVAIMILLYDIAMRHFNVATVISLVPFFFAMNLMASRKLGEGELYLVLALNFPAICLNSLYAIYRMYWQKAYLDELTGVSNRRALNETLNTLGNKYAIAMMDIDHFKKFNDTYGHAEGDNVLRFVAAIFSSEVGSKIFRYGGEEFTIVFRNCDTKDVFAKVEQVRKRIASSAFFIRAPQNTRKKMGPEARGKTPPVSKKKVSVTISIGLACKVKGLRTAEDVILEADQALYEAKEKGRNRVVASREGNVISI